MYIPRKDGGFDTTKVSNNHLKNYKQHTQPIPLYAKDKIKLSLFMEQSADVTMNHEKSYTVDQDTLLITCKIPKKDFEVVIGVSTSVKTKTLSFYEIIRTKKL